MNSKTWMIAAALLCAGTAQAACYTVFKADGSVLQESSTPPVNLSLPIGDTVVEKFGRGASMAMSEPDFFCRERRGEAGAQAVQTAHKSLAAALKAEEESNPAMVIKKPARKAEAEAEGTAAK